MIEKGVGEKGKYLVRQNTFPCHSFGNQLFGLLMSTTRNSDSENWLIVINSTKDLHILWDQQSLTKVRKSG